MTHELIDPARVQAVFRKVRNDPIRKARVFAIMARDMETGFISGDDLLTIELLEGEEDEYACLGQRTVGGHCRLL